MLESVPTDDIRGLDDVAPPCVAAIVGRQLPAAEEARPVTCPDIPGERVIFSSREGPKSR